MGPVGKRVRAHQNTNPPACTHVYICICMYVYMYICIYYVCVFAGVD